MLVLSRTRELEEIQLGERSLIQKPQLLNQQETPKPIGEFLIGQEGSGKTQILEQSRSDQFILDNSLNLQITADVIKFLNHKMNVLAKFNPLQPYQANFLDNCLEFKLEVRHTTYQLDQLDDIKIQLAASGSGKTRELLELLYSQFGYYFVSSFQVSGFGSMDLSKCYEFSVAMPNKADYYIELLYFVRSFVCNYLIDLGYTNPRDILLAQLHPVQFFGTDIFKELFSCLASKAEIRIGRTIEKCFDFVAIDDIQGTLEGVNVFTMPNSRNQLRPFFSPLVFYSKSMGKFPHFIVSGTWINFQLISESMLSGAMKQNQATSFIVISDFKPTSRQNAGQEIRNFYSVGAWSSTRYTR